MENKKLTETVQQNIIFFAKMAGMTKSQITAMTKISHSTVRFGPNFNPTLNTMQNIAEMIGIHWSLLFVDRENNELNKILSFIKYRDSIKKNLIVSDKYKLIHYSIVSEETYNKCIREEREYMGKLRNAFEKLRRLESSGIKEIGKVFDDDFNGNFEGNPDDETPVDFSDDDYGDDDYGDEDFSDEVKAEGKNEKVEKNSEKEKAKKKKQKAKKKSEEEKADTKNDDEKAEVKSEDKNVEGNNEKVEVKNEDEQTESQNKNETVAQENEKVEGQNEEEKTTGGNEEEKEGKVEAGTTEEDKT